MSTITDANKQRFFTSFQSLVDYLLENSGIQLEDLPAILNDWLLGKLASDEDVDLDQNLSGLITVSTAKRAANKAIAEWVQTAPDALDTVQELAAALQNDPDVIQKLFDLIGQKADKKELNKRQLYSNTDFHHADWDGFFQFTSAGLLSRPGAIYTGVASAQRLGIANEYPELVNNEKCFTQVKIENVFYRIIQLDGSNIIGSEIRLPIAHQGQIEKAKFTKNGETVEVPLADINTDADNEIRIVNTDWVDGDEILVEFNTYVEMGFAKNSYILVEATYMGTVFTRSVKLYNGVFETLPEGFTSNIWRSSDLDLSLTIDSIIEAVNTAVPADPEE